MLKNVSKKRRSRAQINADKQAVIDQEKEVAEMRKIIDALTKKTNSLEQALEEQKQGGSLKQQSKYNQTGIGQLHDSKMK